MKVHLLMSKIMNSSLFWHEIKDIWLKEMIQYLKILGKGV